MYSAYRSLFQTRFTKYLADPDSLVGSLQGCLDKNSRKACQLFVGIVDCVRSTYVNQFCFCEETFSHSPCLTMATSLTIRTRDLPWGPESGMPQDLFFVEVASIKRASSSNRLSQ